MYHQLDEVLLFLSGNMTNRFHQEVDNTTRDLDSNLKCVMRSINGKGDTSRPEH